MEKDGDDHHRTIYLLTCDLGRNIETLRLVGLKTPEASDVYFEQLGKELVRALQGSLPKGVIVKRISMDTLSENILTKIWAKKLEHEDALVVSTCADIANMAHGYTLEINRIVDFDGSVIGRGPRPSHPPIDEQVTAIKVMSEGRPVILVEDGAFSGGTLSYIAKLFQEKRINLVTIVIGFIFPNARNELEKTFKGELVVAEEIDQDILDWMPDHDFFPFTPNCGRVCGISIGKNGKGEVVPLYDRHGFSYSIPYLSPYCDMGKWASIPVPQCYRFSLFCIHKSIELFEMLEQLNKKRIKVSEIVSPRLKISVPMAIGQKCLTRELDSPVLSHLHEVGHMLA